MATPPPDTRRFAAFPSTLWSDLLAIPRRGSPEYRARMDALARRYWPPVYAAIRSGGWAEDADAASDLTQEFFLRVLEGDLFGSAQPDRGSFRNYLKAALKHFLLNEKIRDRRLKRGGGQAPLSLDIDRAAPLIEPAAPGADPGELLDRAWGRQMISEAVTELRARLAGEGRAVEAELFEAYELDERQTAAIRELAPRFGLTEAKAWKAVAAARRTLRSILLEKARDYVGNEEHLFRELDELLGRVRP